MLACLDAHVWMVADAERKYADIVHTVHECSCRERGGYFVGSLFSFVCGIREKRVREMIVGSVRRVSTTTRKKQ